MRERRFHLALTTIAIVVLCLAIVIVVRGEPAETLSLKHEVAALQLKVNRNDTAKYPTDSVVAAAYKQASACLSYSDQASNAEVNQLQSQCGWNQQGVANLERLLYDPSPALTTALENGGFDAMPFDAQFLGSTSWLTYWIPVRIAGTGAVVAGMGTPLNVLPTFIQPGCSADQSVTSMQNDPHVQAVDNLVAGEPRYAMPGESFAFNGNGLSNAQVTDAVLCAGSGGSRTVLAKITYDGPTASAQFSVWIAFRTQLISTGEQRVSAVGLDTAGAPGG